MLVSKFADKTAKIGVIGLGYVGLPLALRFSEVGFRVIGFDVDEAKTKTLNGSGSYLAHIDEARIGAAITNEFEATTDFSRVNELDAIIICVPTPLTANREPDLQYVRSTVASILGHLKPGQLISLESTTYPGTTEEEVVTPVAARGFTVGEDIFIAYSPEREDPGNVQFHTRNIPKLVAGVTPVCLETACALYRAAIDEVVPVSTPRVAEMAKLLENIHRAVNIGLVNEMKIVADRMGIDIYEVIDAAATKPFGFVPYEPGPGLGGHCLPIDPFYLTWKAKQYGVDTRFIELAGEVNSNMPQWIIEKAAMALKDDGKSLSGSRVFVLGAAYKKNVGDTRESPAIEIMDQLIKLGAQVSYHDPHVPQLPLMRHYDLNLESTACTKENLSDADLIIIATNHDVFDYELIAASGTKIVDTRGVLRNRPNVISA